MAAGVMISTVGGYDGGRGGGQQHKRPRDQGRPIEGGQYLPGPPRGY
jgi:hypothetical protein